MASRTDKKQNVLLIELMCRAFIQIHQKVLSAIANRSITGVHSDYPLMHDLANGLPTFSDYRYRDDAPKNYTAVYYTNPIVNALLMRKNDLSEFTELKRLCEYINKIAALRSFFTISKDGSFKINEMMFSAVERYIHVYGIEEANQYYVTSVLKPLLLGMTNTKLHLALFVPIALTNFCFDRVKLSDKVYILRISKATQLSRSRISVLGSGTVEDVAGAATHALVNTGWTIEPTTRSELRLSLREVGKEAENLVETFFAALRMATGVDTGYAQVLYLPRKWAEEYYCDLPPIYGSSQRRYPARFDRFYWNSNSIPELTKADASSVALSFRRIRERSEVKVALAVRRLNSCLMRDDDVDAILDAAIGLELLLGDDSQALSYKIRMRAAALAKLGSSAKTPIEIVQQVRSVYDTRSKIVHGNVSKSKKLGKVETEHNAARKLATDVFRFVFDKLLEHPLYLDTKKIDSDLLLSLPEGP